VKRAIAGLGALIIAGATLAPVMAATNYEGAVKFTYTIPASFTAVLAVDYKTAQSAFATAAAASVQTSTSTGSGSCTTPTSPDQYNSYALSFGTITPGTGVTGCNYQQGIGISVNTNDAQGYAIYETLDVTAAPANYGICITTDGATAAATTPSSTNSSAPGAATFNGSNVATSCAVGTLLGPGAATIANAGNGGAVALNQTGTGASSTTVPTTGAIWTVAAGTPATGTNFFGEDVQLNIPPAAPSVSGANHAIIVYFVAN